MFEWDETKRKRVFKEHKVDFARITDVFDDSNALYIEDFEHSTDTEKRFNIIGKTANYELVFVVYMYIPDGIYFITARRAERWMVKEYEKRRKRL